MLRARVPILATHLNHFFMHLLGWDHHAWDNTLMVDQVVALRYPISIKKKLTPFSCRKCTSFRAKALITPDPFFSKRETTL